MPYKDLEQKRKYQREWVAENRRECFEGKCCAKCGLDDYPCLQLDHINPEDKIDHRIWSWSRKRREAEIAKCQILCTDCHLEKTMEYNRMRREALDKEPVVCDTPVINMWT